MKNVAAAPLMAALLPHLCATANESPSYPKRRVRPSDTDWPNPEQWADLNGQVGGRLVRIHSPLKAARTADKATCDSLFESLENPYYIGDEIGLTQSSGWVGAWNSEPSVYGIAAATTADVVAGVNFARKHNLRLVVKGGGHSYQGTSNAKDSLLIWTHPMKSIQMLDAFVPQGCEGKVAPQPAVAIEAGAIWMHVYEAVTTAGGRYVQGGGCATVGVAGLIQSGGFGSFSKRFGLAAAGLLEAEVVTADGKVRLVNSVQDPDLFWGLKGGGGGSLGVITRLTLRTRDLPSTFGGIFARIQAVDDSAFHALILKFLRFYRESLFNPHWGETVNFGKDNSIEIHMVLQGLSQEEAEAAWKPFFDEVAASPARFAPKAPPFILAASARHLWDPDYLLKNVPSLIAVDNRPGAPKANILWVGDKDQSGIMWNGFESVWLPESLLEESKVQKLEEAIFAASRHCAFALHFNKGLAGAPKEEIDAARDTAMHPAVLDAFALAIVASGQGSVYPGVPGHEPDARTARAQAEAIRKAADALREVAPHGGAYVSESDYHQKSWQRAFWGSNYERLRQVKRTCDPEGLFFMHHGVGSEMWSPDGFTRLG